MDKKTVDIYIAGSHFKISHEDPEYVKRVAAIVESKISSFTNENVTTNMTDDLILVCLDICDDMITAQSETAAVKEENKKLNEKISALNSKINSLKREIDYFKTPKFIIPSPIGKADEEIPTGQLCFPPFENREKLEPAVNGLSVANIRRNGKKAGKSGAKAAKQ